jgi:hypothetical protein
MMKLAIFNKAPKYSFLETGEEEQGMERPRASFQTRLLLISAGLNLLFVVAFAFIWSSRRPYFLPDEVYCKIPLFPSLP